MADGQEDRSSAVTAEAMKARTKEFSLRCMRLCEALPDQPEAWSVRKQLGRCATSVAANYRAAQRARSKSEFIAKLGIVEEEIDECAYWLDLIGSGGLIPEARTTKLRNECHQIASIIVASLKSAQNAHTAQAANAQPSAIRHPPSAMQRIGHGFDLHRLEAGLPLVVGGERPEHDRGCAAHSDGDVVYHAVTDAVLGALGQEDIGQLFPDTDAKWQGADSRVFVEEAARRMREAGYAIGNLDVTVILEKPKLGPHKQRIKANLARLLGCELSQVNLKGKTHEKVDALGENRAIACHVVVLLASAKLTA